MHSLQIWLWAAWYNLVGHRFETHTVNASVFVEARSNYILQ